MKKQAPIDSVVIEPEQSSTSPAQGLRATIPTIVRATVAGPQESGDRSASSH